jgi:hypothetical protein
MKALMVTLKICEMIYRVYMEVAQTHFVNSKKVLVVVAAPVKFEVICDMQGIP